MVLLEDIRQAFRLNILGTSQAFPRFAVISICCLTAGVLVAQNTSPLLREPWVQVNLRRGGAPVSSAGWNDVNEDPRTAGVKMVNLHNELGQGTGDSLVIDTASSLFFGSPSKNYIHWPKKVGNRGWGESSFNHFAFHLAGLQPNTLYMLEFHSSNPSARTNKLKFLINGTFSVYSGVRDNSTHLHEVNVISDARGRIHISFWALDSDNTGTGYSNISGFRYRKGLMGNSGPVGSGGFGGGAVSSVDSSSRAVFINFKRYGVGSFDPRFNNIDQDVDYTTPGLKAAGLLDTAGIPTALNFYLVQPADEPFGSLNLPGPYAQFIDSLAITRGIGAPKHDSLSFYLSGLSPDASYDLWLFCSSNNDVGYRTVILNDSLYVYDGIEDNSANWFKANVFSTDSGTIHVKVANFERKDNEINILQSLLIFSGHSNWYSPIRYTEFTPPKTSKGNAGSGNTGPPPGFYDGPYTSVDSLLGFKLQIDSLMVINPDETYPKDNNFAESGLMNVFRWNNDKIYDLKGGKNGPKANNIEILFEPGVPVRITGIHALGHYGGFKIGVLSSDDAVHYDTIAILEGRYDMEVAYEVDDTCQALKVVLLGSSWVDGLEFYGDTLYGDPGLKYPELPAILPDFPDAGRSVAANIFPDDVRLSLSAFADGAVHREYINQGWLMSVQDSLYPKDKYMYAPMQYVGNMKEHWDVLQSLGQKSYLSLKEIPYVYGRSAVKTANDGSMARIYMTLKDETRIFLDQASQKLYEKDSGQELPDGLYKLKFNVRFMAYSGGFWAEQRLNTLEVVNGVLSPTLYQKEGENKPVDDYFAPHTDPANWATYSRAMATMTRIGGRDHSTSPALMADLMAPAQPLDVGLNTLVGVQAGNEDNKDWRSRMAYTTPEEMYAKMKATYDSVKAVDPSMKVILSGLVGLETNMSYYRKIMYLEKLNNERVFDIGAGHVYWSSAGNSSNHHSTANREGQTPEEYGAEDDLAQFQDQWYRWSGGREFYLDEYGYDSDERSDQSLPPNGSLNAEQRQAEGLRRIYKLLSRFSVFQNKPMFMLRSPGNGGPRFATSGLTTTKANHILKDSWFMTYNYTHRLSGYKYYGDVNYGNRNKLGWATVYRSMADQDDRAYDINAWTWNDSSGIMKLYVPNATSAFVNTWSFGHPWGLSRELTVVNDSVRLPITEMSQMVFTYDDPVPLPKAPHDLYYEDAWETAVQIQWENHSDFLQSQQVEYTEDLIGAYTNWNVLNVSWQARDTIIPGLQPNTGYYVRMKSTNSAGVSAYSDTMVVRSRAANLDLDTLYRIDFNGGEYTTTASGWIGFSFPTGAHPREVEELVFDSIHLKVYNISFAPDRDFLSAEGDTVPDEVFNDWWATTDSMRIELNGLDDSKYYTIKLFQATQFSSEQDTAFVSFNGMESLRLVKANRNKWTTFHTIKPVNGRITGWIRAGLDQRPGINGMKLYVYEPKQILSGTTQ